MKSSLAALGILLLAPLATLAALAPVTHPLFDGDAVHEIHLTFDQSNWWYQLTYNYEHYDDIPYIEASFDWDGTHLETVGVRFKGNSSYSYPGDKKSFKVDIDEFVDGQELFGIDKFSLNNCFLDPSSVREKVAYELFGAMGMAANRTNYCALYLNGDYWGLYLIVEQTDQEFIESRWGTSEDGNLWKCTDIGNSTLEYRGSSESLYYNYYDLKTNEEENDWSDLVDFVDALNNNSLSDLPDSLHNRLDVNSALAMLAIDNYTVNLDSYVGRCSNYYFYHRDRDDRMVFTKWDQNESFGIFNQYGYSVTQLQQLSPTWVNPQYGEDRPLAENLYDVSAYLDVYYGHMQKLMAGPAEPSTLIARMEDLRDLIQPWVYADPNTMFTDNDFDICMYQNVIAGSGPGGRTIPALGTFVTNRYNYLQGQIGSWTPIEGLVINEVMPVNGCTVADDAGDYDDWIEIANVGSSTIQLGGLGLTDHLEGTPDYVFPSMTLAPGEYVVIWADEETYEGNLHAPFKLDGDGEDVYLTDGAVIIDQVTFPELANDVSWGRWPDGDGAWQMLSLATPGAVNQNPQEPEDLNLVINEFLAQNDTGITDEMGEFEDWVEIYNPGPEDVEMAGLFLSDELALTTQWAFPEVTIEAGGFLVVWCDSDESDGPLHANFKLGASGEEIGLFGRLAAGNELIDGYEFGAQTADVSEGREYDGGPDWTFFTEPTPGASNGLPIDAPALGVTELRLLPSYPNPFNPSTTLCFELPVSGPVHLEIYDVSGRRVSLLLSESLDAGRHEIVWNGCDPGGNALASGVYLSRLAFGEDVQTQRLVLMK